MPEKDGKDGEDVHPLEGSLTRRVLNMCVTDFLLLLKPSLSWHEEKKKFGGAYATRSSCEWDPWRSQKGGNRVGSIGGNPSGRVSCFAEHEILPVSSLHRVAIRVALFLLPLSLLPNPQSSHLSLPRAFPSSRNRAAGFLQLPSPFPTAAVLIVPYPPPPPEGGYAP
ncbi:hypothetical protein KM043_016969 [Ampulex compressa]|nr:hypothetical protein KM043_016969 [Ampulex compressa]